MCAMIPRTSLVQYENSPINCVKSPTHLKTNVEFGFFFFDVYLCVCARKNRCVL